MARFTKLKHTLLAEQVQEQIAPPDNALQMRGLILSNRSTCLLMANRLDEAQKAMNELTVLLRDKNCKKEFVEKARHTLGYQQLCMDIARRKPMDVPMLERDFEQSRAPFTSWMSNTGLLLPTETSIRKMGIGGRKNMSRHSGTKQRCRRFLPEVNHDCIFSAILYNNSYHNRSPVTGHREMEQ